MNDNVQQHLHAALDEYDSAVAAMRAGRAAVQAVIAEQSAVAAAVAQAAAAIRDASAAVSDASIGLSVAFTRMGETVEADNAALDAVQRANRRVIAALRAAERTE